jgi:hypothetical protein
MRVSLLLFLSLTFIYCSAQNPNKDYSDKSPTVNSNNIFRSTENLYRIKIPKKWSINKGNSLGVEFNSKSPLEDASLSIIVANLKTPPKFTAHDVPVETIIESLKKNVPSTTLIESEKQFLSNEKALYIKYRFNYKTLDIDTDIICIQYSVIKKTRMFTITLQAQELTYPAYRDVFNETLKSFVFEDY